MSGAEFRVFLSLGNLEGLAVACCSCCCSCVVASDEGQERERAGVFAPGVNWLVFGWSWKWGRGRTSGRKWCDCLFLMGWLGTCRGRDRVG